MKKIQEVIYRAEESNEHSHEIIEILKEKMPPTQFSAVKEKQPNLTQDVKNLIYG